MKLYQGKLSADELLLLEDSIGRADPSKSGANGPWIIRMFLQKNIRLPEDIEKIRRRLEEFSKVKKLLPVKNRDINIYQTFGHLAITLDKLKETLDAELAKREEKKKISEIAGQEIITEMEGAQTPGTLSLIRATTPEASALLAKDTDWCVSDPGIAKDYVETAPLYFIDKNGARYILIHEDPLQVKDVHDSDISEETEKNIIHLIRDFLPRLLCQKHEPKYRYLPMRTCPQCANSGKIFLGASAGENKCRTCLIDCDSCSNQICSDCEKICASERCTLSLCEECLKVCEKCRKGFCEKHTETVVLRRYRDGDMHTTELLVCKECLVRCAGCGKKLVEEDSETFSCEMCEKNYCLDCFSGSCEGCGSNVCSNCLERCNSCDKAYCENCLKKCELCEEKSCERCLNKCKQCKKSVCENCTAYRSICMKCDEGDTEDDTEEVGAQRHNPDFLRGKIVEIEGQKWEIRANEFIFPPPPIQKGEVRLIRELTDEEKRRHRYYLDIRATPYIEHPEDFYNFERDVPKQLIPFYRIIFEILGKSLTTPRLDNWRENRATARITDIAHFLNYRPAMQHEVDAFLELAPQFFEEFS